MKVKCGKCRKEFEMPDGFSGGIICEDCDPMMKPKKKVNKPCHADCKTDITYHTKGYNKELQRIKDMIMALKHLSLKPHKVTQDFWWYEENGGITLCVKAYRKNGLEKVSLHSIKWSSIRAALKRKDKKDREV